MKYQCNSCSYLWISKKTFGSPARCPSCNSKEIDLFYEDVGVSVSEHKTLKERFLDLHARLVHDRGLLARETLAGKDEISKYADAAEELFLKKLRKREEELLIKIDNALRKFKEGTYGICDNCGMEIDIKRLEARPVTTICLECRVLQEENEKIEGNM